MKHCYKLDYVLKLDRGCLVFHENYETNSEAHDRIRVIIQSFIPYHIAVFYEINKKY